MCEPTSTAKTSKIILLMKPDKKKKQAKKLLQALQQAYAAK